MPISFLLNSDNADALQRIRIWERFAPITMPLTLIVVRPVLLGDTGIKPGTLCQVSPTGADDME